MELENERRLRLEAKEKVCRLQMELDILNRELRLRNAQDMQSLHNRRLAALEQYRIEYERTHPYRSSCPPRRVEDGEDEIDTTSYRC